jgi:hypothetical protein
MPMPSSPSGSGTAVMGRNGCARPGSGNTPRQDHPQWTPAETVIHPPAHLGDPRAC